ncbi:MAG: hypothetical protein ACUVX1_10020, partial [Chloroflexota bacterium]
HWEATSNGAERVARLFRHLQAPHFALRSERSLAAAIETCLMPTGAKATAERGQQAARCSRARKKGTRRGSILTQTARAA